MPLVALPIELPADLAAVHAGDLDADGAEELVLVSRHPRSDGAWTSSLHIVALDADGELQPSRSLELGAEPLLWDIQGGLWAIDADGARDLLTGRRVLQRSTVLAALGETTPEPADIAADLNHDGVAELLAWSAGRLHVVSVDGRDWGSVAAARDP